MSNIDDIRKILQDLIAPGLASLATKVEDNHIAMNRRFDDAEKLAAVRHESLLRELQLSRRMDQLEDRLPKPQAVTG